MAELIYINLKFKHHDKKINELTTKLNYDTTINTSFWCAKTEEFWEKKQQPYRDIYFSGWKEKKKRVWIYLFLPFSSPISK